MTAPARLRADAMGAGGASLVPDTYGDLARQLRADSIRCSSAAGSGHPTSSLSAADLMAVLLSGHLRYDWSSPDDLANDHLIFSKGRASPLLYSLFRAAGAIDDAELMTYRSSAVAWKVTRPLSFPGSMSRPARRGRACRSGRASRSRDPRCSTRRTTCGSSSATARAPKARSGRRSIVPATSGWATSPRSST